MSAQCEATLKAAAGVPMSVFERYLSVWVFLCILAGVGLGQLAPGVFQAIGRMEVAQVNLPVGLLIWVMVIPMLVKVDFGALHEVKGHIRGIGVTLFVNWLVKPFSMAFLGWLFVRNVFAPMLPADQLDSYIAGLILLAAAPCAAMVFVWSRLSNGDPLFTLSQVALNDTIMVVAFAPLVGFLLGISAITVQQALPGEVFYLADTHEVVVARVFEVDFLATGVDRLQRAKSTWPAGKGDVGDRQEDVQVLAVGDEDREAEQHGQRDQQEHRLEDLVGRLAERVEQRGEPLRREGPLEERQRRIGGAGQFVDPLGVDRGTAVGQQGPHDVEDHEQDEPGRPEVGAKEPAAPTEPGGRFFDPDRHEGRDRRDAEHGEEVFDEPEPGPVAEERDLEARVDQTAEGFQHGEQQHHEAPEHREVRDARHRPLEQLALTGDFQEFSLDRRPGFGTAVTLQRLGGAAQPDEEHQAASGDAQADQGEQQAEDEPDRHHR